MALFDVRDAHGVATVDGDPGGWTVTFADPPAGGSDPLTTGSDPLTTGSAGGCGPATPQLIGDAAAAVAANGGGPTQMWIHRPRPDLERAAAAVGLEAGRALYQMRRPLPYDLDDPDPTFATRAFRPGCDEAEWVEVNNRAFSWHPEQGGWSVTSVEEREAEDWFDAEGFLLHDDAEGRIDGFCWTKVHPDHDPPLGEIYVIAADPAPGGGSRRPTPGLGRRLTAAGLDYLYRVRGIGTGMLYVDASNRRAVKLYVDMGFVVNHIDQVFAGTISPSATGAA